MSEEFDILQERYARGEIAKGEFITAHRLLRVQSKTGWSRFYENLIIFSTGPLIKYIGIVFAKAPFWVVFFFAVSFGIWKPIFAYLPTFLTNNGPPTVGQMALLCLFFFVSTVMIVLIWLSVVSNRSAAVAAMLVAFAIVGVYVEDINAPFTKCYLENISGSNQKTGKTPEEISPPTEKTTGYTSNKCAELMPGESIFWPLSMCVFLVFSIWHFISSVYTFVIRTLRTFMQASKL